MKQLSSTYSDFTKTWLHPQFTSFGQSDSGLVWLVVFFSLYFQLGVTMLQRFYEALKDTNFVNL